MRRSRPGLSLVDVLLAASVMAVLLAAILGIYCHITSRWSLQAARAKSIQSASLAIDLMAKEIGSGIRFTDSLSGRNSVLTLPADTDAQGNYTLNASTGRYASGTLVHYYLSDASGNPAASGAILWREYNNGGGWIKDTAWSLLPGSTTRGRVGTVSALTFTTSGLTANLVRITLTLAVTEGVETANNTLQRDIYLSNNNPGSGSLSVNTGTPSGTVNLTTVGAVDWSHWGYSGTAQNHKSSGGGQISSYTVIGGGGVAGFNSGTTWNWTDGTPTVSASTARGIRITGTGSGFTLTAPAGTTTRTLVIYVSVRNSQGSFQASLSDNSAAPYADTSLSNAAGTTDGLYTVTYSAGSSGQTLTLTWQLQTDFGSGSVALLAATLQ